MKAAKAPACDIEKRQYIQPDGRQGVGAWERMIIALLPTNQMSVFVLKDIEWQESESEVAEANADAKDVRIVVRWLLILSYLQPSIGIGF